MEPTRHCAGENGMSALLRAKNLLPASFPLYLGGKPLTTQHALRVVDKYTQEEFASVSAGDAAVATKAFELAQGSVDRMAALPSYERKRVLLYVADQINQRKDQFTYAIVREAGKTLADASAEVGRAVDTFTSSAEESVRRTGECGPLDISARNAGYSQLITRFPIGVVSLITPFNFPLNLVAHKVGPAIAAGCPWVLKPSEKTPICSALLGDILAGAGLPDGSWSMVPNTADAIPVFVNHRAIRAISFTGSAKVGWHIYQNPGKKKVLLELGGNAACIVDQTADLSVAAKRIVFGAFYVAGQSCISVQRIYAHESVAAKLRALIKEEALKLKTGDPFDASTTLGPLIGKSEAARLSSWTKAAVSRGATLAFGTPDVRGDIFYGPTMLESVPKDADLSCQEAFGPVCVFDTFREWPDVIARVNDSDYGLQTGIFTNDLKAAFAAYQQLHVGGVVLNDIPSARVDTQPYGGIKDSGVGREGIKYLMAEFTEPKVLLMKGLL